MQNKSILKIASVRRNFITSNADSCVVNKNLQNQVISEDDNSEFLNIDKNIVVCGELGHLNIVKTTYLEFSHLDIVKTIKKR